MTEGHARQLVTQVEALLEPLDEEERAALLALVLTRQGPPIMRRVGELFGDKSRRMLTLMRAVGGPRSKA